MHFPIVVKITVIKFMGAVSHNLRDEKLIEKSNININEYALKCLNYYTFGSRVECV